MFQIGKSNKLIRPHLTKKGRLRVETKKKGTGVEKQDGYGGGWRESYVKSWRRGVDLQRCQILMPISAVGLLRNQGCD
jgi:hypothetical protein